MNEPAIPMSNPGNSGVTRYDLEDDGQPWYSQKIMVEQPEGWGDWVRYSDYAALEERCKRLEEAAQKVIALNVSYGRGEGESVQLLRAALTKGTPNA